MLAKVKLLFDKLDQDDLETVIPSIGGKVRLVNGRRRGEVATLQAIDEARFCVRVELADGTVLDGVEYEDACKIDSSF